MAKKNNANRHGGSAIKRFIGNKNTVMILGVLACIGVLIGGYNFRVRQAIDPIAVPYAKVSIPARTLITSDMVGRIRVSSSVTSEASNLVKTSAEVINKYVSYKTNIPKGSLFYKEQIKEADEMPDAAFANIADGYSIFSLDVSFQETFANSIRAGDYIDLYMSASESSTGEKLVIYGPLIESIRVLAVKDSNGNNIIGTTVANGKPSELLFAVKEDMFRLLMETKWVKNGDIELTPVIRNKKYTADANETLVSSEYLQSFIKNQTTEL